MRECFLYILESNSSKTLSPHIYISYAFFSTLKNAGAPTLGGVFVKFLHLVDHNPVAPRRVLNSVNTSSPFKEKGYFFVKNRKIY